MLASASDRYTAAASALSGCDRRSTSSAASDRSPIWNEAATPNAPISTVNSPATTRSPPGTVRACARNREGSPGSPEGSVDAPAAGAGGTVPPAPERGPGTTGAAATEPGGAPPVG
ncbi:hypothetical protein Sgou_49320 [Streptomyces gougerotii]|uniref:Uncharacterized protein n=2 Tax=Streptomyces diastaticus group TaxID=2849069 RepID=A0A8H9LTM0_9ACTN|nr:hypothetical protein Srut_22990 [Streptomyces rutgersensis]GFH71013.1 hypothetical protein Sdia_17810 [Streptomyces diastaticus subsp. diastaticus]GFH80262.1 hypothetical protein Sgou_49320 [Streptomyces gougerotii]GGU33067.1 hypothetical protein GCM10015534_39470 [Streptomyces diastaticus subsp. diastaticus]GGU78032.1 hypothetical protein GCM10010227_35290 [Streptomyces gougerotii]